jgi:crotonobetainyl-CoA:carnitine CoA-transferase CaiB-like acyl-CoA transferase
MVQVESAEHGAYWRHGALHSFSEAGAQPGPAEPAGGHTASVLREFGYADEEITSLVGRGVIELA